MRIPGPLSKVAVSLWVRGLRRDRGDLISVAAQIVERAAAMVAVEQEAGLDGAARRELADSRAAIEARERRTQK